MCTARALPPASHSPEHALMMCQAFHFLGALVSADPYKEAPMKAATTLVVMLLSAAACTDEPKKSPAPTAPSAAVSNRPEAPAPRIGTVCLSYGRDRELVRAELKNAPANETLQRKLKSLDELILDAC